MVRCPGCPDTTRQFKTLSALCDHASSLKASHSFCAKCIAVFSSKEELASHHMNPHVFDCTMCHYKFPSSSALEAHVKSDHTKCPACGEVFRSKGFLKKHTKVKHASPPPAAVTTFVCEVACGRLFSSKALRDEHVSTTHPACEHCRQLFLSDVVLQNHVASAHSQCNCTICLRKSDLELHSGVGKDQFVSHGPLQSHYLGSPKPVQCTICTMNFSDADRLLVHISQVHSNLLASSNFPSENPPPANVGPAEPAGGLAPQDALGISSSSPLDVPHAQLSLDDALPGNLANVPQETDLPSLPPAADIRSRLISTTRVHSPELVEKRSSSSESHHETEGRTSSPPNSASISGFDCDVESDLSQASASSSLQSSASSPEGFSAAFEDTVTRDISSPGAVQEEAIAPLPPDIISGALADNINQTLINKTRVKHSRTSVSPRENTQSFHCRICRKAACDDITVTICGHIFCNKCITQAVISKPSCPACSSALLLYCLFRIDLSV